MDITNSEQTLDRSPSERGLSVKLFGVGEAGLKVAELLVQGGFPAANTMIADSDPAALQHTTAPHKVRLETKLLRGLGSGGDPERGRALAEEQGATFKSFSEGADLVFVIAGLGGGCGTGAAPVVASFAKEAGALVLGFATTPFDCEGSRRKQIAQKGLESLRDAADGVISLPNQRVLKCIDENASVLDAFKATNALLADAVRGLWRLASYKGLIDIHFTHLCELLRDQHTESAFAVAEAIGPARSREVMDRLFASPLLNGGAVLPECDAVLVSLLGGPDLTMAEVNRVMQEVSAKAEATQVTMGAAIAPEFQDRLAVTIIAATKHELIETTSDRTQPEELPEQLLGRSSVRPNSRFVPPAPSLHPEQVRQILSRQGHPGRSRRSGPKLRQGQLPLDIISKGRFDKSEPTIHKGEDLDVPTYIRRGISLN